MKSFGKSKGKKMGGFVHGAKPKGAKSDAKGLIAPKLAPCSIKGK
jgi:hypothetical protein